MWVFESNKIQADMKGNAGVCYLSVSVSAACFGWRHLVSTQFLTLGSHGSDQRFLCLVSGFCAWSAASVPGQWRLCLVYSEHPVKDVLCVGAKASGHLVAPAQPALQLLRGGVLRRGSLGADSGGGAQAPHVRPGALCLVLEDSVQSGERRRTAAAAQP